VLETVRILVEQLDVPLIGFAGAPFTVASYLIEGKPSRTYGLTKSMMHGEPDLWHQLMERLADLAIASLRSQVDAGASAIQLFDSWVGALSEADYVRYVAPHTARIFGTRIPCCASAS
jgi:uroporphyrinogen decarboxylase